MHTIKMSLFLGRMTAGDLQSVLDADTAVRTSSTSPPPAQLIETVFKPTVANKWL